MACLNQNTDTRDIQGQVSQVWHFTTVCAHFCCIFVIFSSNSLYFTSWYAHISWWTSTIWASRHSIHLGLSEKCQLEPSNPFRLASKCSTKNLQHLFWDGGSITIPNITWEIWIGNKFWVFQGSETKIETETETEIKRLRLKDFTQCEVVKKLKKEFTKVKIA